MVENYRQAVAHSYEIVLTKPLVIQTVKHRLYRAHTLLNITINNT
jgi:hypothetical protein